ncbi:hypothetical protein [Halodesulfovibrio aestuarii]|uniref:Uncharacterized protein n=1 Tax=Halodesulfovibrio aestuarii TaxID=126333 RepID=A0A8G2FHR7_9BACT|nr:hypothetical protein [Halodesulfovibrio aestuarii]SHJ06739.1 hypothetical protein SAMN05660830_01537 [Halodesulfovibrio aestuarii]
MTQPSLVQTIKNTLAHNKKCTFTPETPVIFVTSGVTGGKELLVPIFLDHIGHKGFWYGYIQHATKGLSGYFSLLVWLNQPIKGENNNQLLSSFHNLAWKEKLFEPSTIQNEHDAFIHAHSFNDAVTGLIHIISQFDIEKRFPNEDSRYYDDPIELNIIMYLTNCQELILGEE